MVVTIVMEYRCNIFVIVFYVLKKKKKKRMLYLNILPNTLLLQHPLGDWLVFDGIIM